jgi:hypothetical protein
MEEALSIQKHPLAWPQGQPRASLRKRAQFNTGNYAWSGASGRRLLTIADAMDRLREEIRKMNISFRDDCVVSSNLVLNLGGDPRSGQPEPVDPGVAVYWITPKGDRRVMAIDIYDRVADNIAAVARTLEYLRGIERHGGAHVMEQAFTGFTALPPPSTCWQTLGISPPAKGETKETLIPRIKTAHKFAMMSLPREANGDVRGAAAVNAARDEAIQIAEARQ